MKVAIVTIRSSSGEEGGAERLYRALLESFVALGHEADEITLESDESSFERILKNYLYFHDLDLSNYDLVVSTKAPTWMVRHPNHVCYLIHTIRAFYDMFDELFPKAHTQLMEQRQLIHRLDTLALSPPRCRRVFSIGYEVSARLQHWNGRDAEVLHPPLWSNPFQAGDAEALLFLPGRLHAWKRTDLIVKAMQHVKRPVRLMIAGQGDAEQRLRELAKADARIEFLGRVTDATLVDLYSRCVAVPFTPKREDYGYVTLEAFASGKPVITCDDSGEAARIVREQQGGMVVAPDPESLAKAIEWMIDHPAESSSMGRRGQAWVNGLHWTTVAKRLMAALGEDD